MSLALRVTQPAPACNEHELVAAVRRGNDRAFEELYARYRSRIGSYIFGMVGDHGRAEDIAQEVFISALRRLRETERTIIFKPWIYEIAKNACIDEFRRTRRMHEVPLEPETDRDFPVAALPSTSPTPDVAVESKQRLTDLRGAFRGLSESHHRILVLRELEGLSYNQIGARLGMTKPVVESTLFRARRRLGEEFEELESGRRCERVQSLIAAAGERPLRSLGIRERRQFARHVAHCELCLRQARDADIDESLYRAPNLLGRMAVLAPIPWLRSALPYFDPTRPGSGVGRAIATAAIVVAGAGAGGGLVSDMSGHASRPPGAVLAAPLPPVGVATTRPSAAASEAMARRADRSGVAASAVAVVSARQSKHLSIGDTGSSHTLGLAVSPSTPAGSQAQHHIVGSPSDAGLTNPQPVVSGSPAGAGASAVSEPNQPVGGESHPGLPSGSADGATPSSGALLLNPAQPASGTTGAASPGLAGLPPASGLLSGVTGSATTSIPSLPGLPAGASGSTGAPPTNGTSSTSGPGQAPASGPTTPTSSPSLPGGAGQAAGPAVPSLGPTLSS